MTAPQDSARARQSHSGLRARVFVHLLRVITTRYELWIAERKRALLGSLRGTILEIGPGAGVNLGYYAPGITWIGIEPNVHMQAYLRKEAERRGLQVDLRTGVAERLEAADQSADAVVSTLVLCSVASVADVLQEIQRVLKPGGKYVFIEHVAAPAGTWLRRMQRILCPCFRFFAVGCHPDRETWTEIDRAGFAEVQYERFRAPLPVVSPHIAGVAIR
jgi:ubiquinone/menaquinone biosynthesis C-methylase UbiE